VILVESEEGFDRRICKQIFKMDNSKKLNRRFGRKFEDDIEAIKFWDMPTDYFDSSQGMDGSQWILEANVNGRYHVVNRWSPYNTAFQETLSKLILATGLNKIEEDLQ